MTAVTDATGATCGEAMGFCATGVASFATRGATDSSAEIVRSNFSLHAVHRGVK
jgi:hypothetical protein